MMYLITFQRTKKTKNVALPPIKMAGQQVEHLKAGRLYQCDGLEARMAERVLAARGIAIMNITPKHEGLNIECSQIVGAWSRLNRMTKPQTVPRRVFGNYWERADD